jgi:Leucine-rich repeat (LRR) protein
MAPPKRPPQTFRAAFDNSLKNRTGIVVSNADVLYAEMARDVDRSIRLGGFSGDEPPGNQALKAMDAQAVEMSEDIHGPDGLLGLVEKLGPLNPNLTSEAFIKPFFKHLNLSQLSIISFDEDLTKFSNLTNLDLSKNNISNIDFLSPKLKFLKVYNNKVSQISCAKQPSLCFLGAGYNALTSAGMSQLTQRFRSLLSLDVCYNNLTNLRQFLDDAQALTKMRHLALAGNPLCLLPYYRLVVIKRLPQLQLLDEQAVGEAEAADSQLVEHSHLEMPSHLNVVVSFSQVTFLNRILVPLAR